MRTKFKPAEIKVFRYLVSKRSKEATTQELCEIMPASTVSVTINELQKDGFVQKVPELSSDGSLYKVKLLYVPKNVRSYLAPPHRREIDVNSAYFMENVRQFQRIFGYVETDLTREREGIETHFILDFSEVHDFLHPDIEQIYPSIGWVMYMFEEKLRKDKYVFPPPAAWEMLSHMEKTARLARRFSDFKTLTKDLRMKKFLSIIRKPYQSPEQAYRELLDAYKEMKELSGLLLLADRNLVKHLFPNVIKRFKGLIADDILVSLSSVLENYHDYSIDSDVYMKVLDYLMWRRFDAAEKNVVDAMNMGLTYQLTDNLYKSNNEYFVLVTHSKKPLEVFYDVKWTDDPKGIKTLVREPSFMTTRIFLEKEFLDSNVCVDYAKQGRYITSYLWQHRDLLDYSERFIQAFELDGERILKEEFTPVCNLLSQIQHFESHYVSQIQRILNINVERIRELSKIVPINQAKKIQELLQNREEYTNQMIEAHDIIMSTVKETYRVLRNFVGAKYRRLLTPDMVNQLKKLDEQL